MVTGRTTKRIGPKMLEAAQFVRRHPGASQKRIAAAVGPNGSHRYGTEIVKRAERAGLIYNTGSGCARYRYWITADGLALCQHAEATW